MCVAFRWNSGPGVLVMALAAGLMQMPSQAGGSDLRNTAREGIRPVRRGSLPLIESSPAASPRPAVGRPLEPVPPSGSTAQPALPWEDIEKAVAEHFAGLKDHKSGDLLARADVAALGPKLKALGWLPEDWKDILEDTLPDNDELLRTLRTPRGRAFMRKVASQPGGYDRLDRLRGLPQGGRRLREIVSTPDGDKLIEYLTTTDGGRALGKQLSKTKDGRGFNQPTGRIYTTADLLQRLKSSHEPPAAPEQPER